MIRVGEIEDTAIQMLSTKHFNFLSFKAISEVPAKDMISLSVIWVLVERAPVALLVILADYYLTSYLRFSS